MSEVATPERVIPTWPLWLAMAIYGVLLACHLIWALHNLRLPDELFTGSLAIAYHAWRHLGGEPLYRDFRQPPHAVALYGPLTFALPAALVAPGAGPLDLLFAGRLISLCATAGTGALVYLIARRCRVGRVHAALAALAALSAPVFWTIGGELRADPPATLLSLLGIWLYLETRSTRWWWAAGVPSVGAFLFKQSALLPLPAVAAARWREGSRRSAVLFALAAAAVLALVALAIDRATDGGYALNAFAALGGNRTLSNLLAWPTAVLPLTLPIYLFAALWLLRHRRSLGVVELYALVALILPLAATFRDGAAEYYFCESVAAAAVLMAWQWQHLEQREARDHHRLLSTTLTLLPATIGLVGLTKLVPGPLARVGSALAGRPGQAGPELTLEQPLLCTVDAINVGSLTRGAAPPVLVDSWTVTGLVDQGVIDDRQVRQALAAGRYRSVVLRRPVGDPWRYQSTTELPRSWLALIARRYRLAGRLGGRFFHYRPQGAR